MMEEGPGRRRHESARKLGDIESQVRTSPWAGFEVYGLEMDDEGLASYPVELSVEGADERNLVDRVARGLVELFSRGGDDEPRVSWERTVPVDGDRAIDYISVELPQLDTGAYTMRILITDLGSGETVETTRGFRVQASDDG